MKKRRLNHTKIICSLSELEELSVKLKNDSYAVVSTNGCFDILHMGHIKYLEQASGLGDVLVVGVNSDISVKRLKGPSRPIFSQSIRLEQLAALESVDYVFCFEEDTPLNFLSVLKPSLHVKGGDYEIRDLPETQVVRKHGGEVKCLDFVSGFSTTSLLDKLSSIE